MVPPRPYLWGILCLREGCVPVREVNRAPDSPLDSHTGGCKDGGKSKCGKGHTDCDPQSPPVTAAKLGYCQKIDGNGEPVADKECARCVEIKCRGALPAVES